MAGDCLLLDCPCPQLITRSLICKWFRTAVLPGDTSLYNDLLRPSAFRKQCISCGGSFAPTGNRSVYCEKCAAKIRRMKATERKRKQREQTRR